MTNDYYFDYMEIEYSPDVLSTIPNGKLPRGLLMNPIEVLAELLMNMHEEDIVLCPPPIILQTSQLLLISKIYVPLCSFTSDLMFVPYALTSILTRPMQMDFTGGH